MTLQDFDNVAQAAYIAALAATAGVNESAITLSIVTGSINVTATILTPVADAPNVSASISTAIATGATNGTFLGVNVVNTPEPPMTQLVILAAPSPPPPSPPPSPPVVTAVQDPHIVFAHGGKADFRGRDGSVYNMLSAPRISFALMTSNATFIKPGYRPKLVHGSFFTRAFWTLCTSHSRTILHVNASAAEPGFDVSHKNGSHIASLRGVWKEYKLEDVRVFYKQSTLFLRAAGFETNVTRKPVYNHLSGPQWRLDMSVRRLDGTELQVQHGASSRTIAPHGIVGQSWDGDNLAVDGKQDDYEIEASEVWTTAMAEGAIEGTANDYVQITPHDTRFKFSRFDAKRSTPPRSVNALRGARRASTKRDIASAVDQLGIGYR